MSDRGQQMWNAARDGKVQEMLGLLDGGADIEWKNDDGSTALHVSAIYNHTACVSALLGRGANPNALNVYKQTPLQFAAYNGSAANVKLLLEAGADPSLKNKDGKTALDAAKQKNHTECIRLLENPAAVRAQAPAVVKPAAGTKVEAGMANLSIGSPCDIFGSYKQNDGSDALLMNMYYTLKPLEVWLDKKRGDERSESGMVAGVKACRLFCAVISPAYFGSGFCLLEVRTAIQQKKKIAVCFNGSKYKVQEALGWIPAEFSHLKNDELIMLHEDDEFMQIGLNKIRKRV